ncbi:hypothetical protein Busp01_35200 [Trinickia caryophylli]|nr:hypothetical protein Busp01_35200 [Trinickia caryophylli]
MVTGKDDLALERDRFHVGNASHLASSQTPDISQRPLRGTFNADCSTRQANEHGIS